LIEYEKPLPDPPAPIVNVRILADFVREKTRRERALLDTTQVKNELERKLEEVASEIKPILPKNIPILYTYQGENIDRHRKRYGIILEQGSVRLWRLAS
jgi:lantibiotic modifying enzyme